MQTDLNRMSFEKNHPFTIEAQDQMPKRVGATSLRGWRAALAEVSSARRLFRIQPTSQITVIDIFTEIRHATGNQPPFPLQITIDDLQAAVAPIPPKRGDVWAILASLTGTIEAPADWAAEHDHYLYGTPKRP